MAKNDQDVSAVVVETISESILVLRGQKVMLDFTLADLYGVQTKALNQAVRRNLERFPEDFMFQLTAEEVEGLRSQIVTLKGSGVVDSRSQIVTLKHGQNIKYLPYAFTEQGVAMLSSALRSPKAVAVNIEIMRTFVRMRKVAFSNEELARKLDELDRRVSKHDAAISEIIEAIRQLMLPPDPGDKRSIGFAPWKDNE